MTAGNRHAHRTFRRPRTKARFRVSLKELSIMTYQKAGYSVCDVEARGAGGRHVFDAYGFGDLLACIPVAPNPVGPLQEFILIQVTDAPHLAAHRTTLWNECPDLGRWVRTGGICEINSWTLRTDKKSPTGFEKEWRRYRIEIDEKYQGLREPWKFMNPVRILETRSPSFRDPGWTAQFRSWPRVWRTD